MKRSLQTLFLGAVLFAAASAQGQSLDGISLIPALPGPATPITVRATGMHDSLGQPFHSNPWRVVGNQVQMDVLFLTVPTAAPPVPALYVAQAAIGTLPRGAYSLRVRTFLGAQGEFNSWTFPDVFPAVVGAGPRATLTTAFNVVPEPAAFSLAASGALPLASIARRLRRRNAQIFA